MKALWYKARRRERAPTEVRKARKRERLNQRTSVTQNFLNMNLWRR